MNWLESVHLELERGAEAERQGNHGRARTSARRAVGIAIAELQRRFPDKTFGHDFIGQLRSLARDPEVKESVRDAADRLQARLSREFESPSKDPIDDARIIISYVVERLG
jgi:hypothetical protein